MTDQTKKNITTLSMVGSMLGVAAASIVFLFTTFATKADVESKNDDVIEHLSDMKGDIREIRAKIDQLLKR